MANVAKIVSLIGKVARVERKPIPKKSGKDPELKAATSATEVIKKEKYLKETMARPVVRNKDIKKRSTQELSPSEKAADILSKKSPVTTTKKKPMSSAKIKETRATARKAKFDKLLAPRPKPKPNRAPLKPINNRPAPRVPPHKVDVKIMRKKLHNKGVTKKEQDLADYRENVTDRATGRQYEMRKSELDAISEAGKNAKANPKNWDIADQKRASNISEGRGNTLQPDSVTKNPIERGNAAQKKEARMEKRKARQANLRDRRADIAGAKRADYKKPRVIKYTTGPKSAKPGTTKRMKIGDQTVSRTNDPRNAASDAGNMKNKLKAIDAKAAANRKRRAIGKGGNKVSPELKAKVEATLNSGKTARKSRELQNTFNKPKFSRNVTTGRLRTTRPIKPVKK